MAVYAIIGYNYLGDSIPFQKESITAEQVISHFLYSAQENRIDNLLYQRLIIAYPYIL